MYHEPPRLKFGDQVTIMGYTACTICGLPFIVAEGQEVTIRIDSAKNITLVYHSYHIEDN
jgi:hypothetical protein